MTRNTWIIVLVAGGVGLADPDRPPRREGRRVAGGGAAELLLEPERARELDREPDSSQPDLGLEGRLPVGGVEHRERLGSGQDRRRRPERHQHEQLDSAWDSFKSAVDDVPDDASVSDALNDVSQAAQSLLSTTKSTLTGPDCSSS